MSDKSEIVQGKMQATTPSESNQELKDFRFELLARCRDLFAIKRSEKIAEIMNDPSLAEGEKEIKMVTLLT